MPVMGIGKRPMASPTAQGRRPARSGLLLSALLGACLVLGWAHLGQEQQRRQPGFQRRRGRSLLEVPLSTIEVGTHIICVASWCIWVGPAVPALHQGCVVTIFGSILCWLSAFVACSDMQYGGTAPVPCTYWLECSEWGSRSDLAKIASLAGLLGRRAGRLRSGSVAGISAV